MSPAANVVLETTEALGSRAGLEADLAMDVIGLLAQVGFSLPPDPPASAGGIVPIDALWGYVTTLRLVEALIFISFGVVWLFYGWRVFKILVTISFGLMGLFAGVYIQRSLIGGEVVWLATLFMLLFGFLAVWFMKWSVSVLGALAGAVLSPRLIFLMMPWILRSLLNFSTLDSRIFQVRIEPAAKALTSL